MHHSHALATTTVQETCHRQNGADVVPLYSAGLHACADHQACVIHFVLHQLQTAVAQADGELWCACLAILLLAFMPLQAYNAG